MWSNTYSDGGRRQYGMALEDAVAEDRHEVAVHARTAQRVVLDVVVGISGSRDGTRDPDPLEVGVHGDRERELRAGAPERLVDRTPVGDPRSAGQEHAHELFTGPEPADLLRRRFRMLWRNNQQATHPWLLLQIALQQPVVVTPAQPRR